jgi:hypothetical protein
MHGDERYLYYTTGQAHQWPGGKTYRVNKADGTEELFFGQGGGDMIYVEGDYVYVSQSHGLPTQIWKINKHTAEVVWTWTGYGACYGYGVGKYGLYGRGASRGYSYVWKENGTVKWTSTGLTRYPDFALPDLKNDLYVETGLWSPNTIQRVSKADGSIIWQKKGPTEEMGEVTQPVDITDDVIWVAWYKGEYPNQYFYALATWDRDTGALIEAFPEKPYSRIWHLGPEGSLIFNYSDETGNALVWNYEISKLSKINSQTWEVYWTTDLGWPLHYAPHRLFIDGEHIYLRDFDDPTMVYQYLWRAPAGASADLVRRGAWPEHRHFVLSKDGDLSVDDRHGTPGFQTLYGLVKNTGNTTLPAGTYKIVWNITTETGYVKTVETFGTITLPPGELTELTYDVPAEELPPDKYYVKAYASYYGVKGEKTKTFTFTVVP